MGLKNSQTRDHGSFPMNGWAQSRFEQHIVSGAWINKLRFQEAHFLVIWIVIRSERGTSHPMWMGPGPLVFWTIPPTHLRFLDWAPWRKGGTGSARERAWAGHMTTEYELTRRDYGPTARCLASGRYWTSISFYCGGGCELRLSSHPLGVRNVILDT